MDNSLTDLVNSTKDVINKDKEFDIMIFILIYFILNLVVIFSNYIEINVILYILENILICSFIIKKYSIEEIREKIKENIIILILFIITIIYELIIIINNDTYISYNLLLISLLVIKLLVMYIIL